MATSTSTSTSTTKQPVHMDTLLAQAGTHYQKVTSVGSQDLVPPIHLASTYERAEDGSYPGGFVYSRHANPTRATLEKTLTELEAPEAEWCAAFASGMAAANAILQSFGGPAAFVVMPNDLYHGVRSLLHTVFQGWGQRFAAVDMSDLAAVEGALRAAFEDKDVARVLLWMESPSNPLLQVTDIPAVLALTARLADASGKTYVSVADVTWMTPYLLRPLALGVDLSFSSATKFLGGHSDLLAGVITGRRQAHRGGGDGSPIDLEAPIRQVQQTAGAVLSPFESWLLLRGLRTLACRMRTHCENAGRLASFLAGHPAIEHVHYPGLPTHPGHKAMAKMLVARKQGEATFGSMVSIQIRGGKAAALSALARLRVFRRATSLGSTESLIEHRASVEGPLTTTPDNLVRISVGIEAYEDLEADLKQALDAVAGAACQAAVAAAAAAEGGEGKEEEATQ